MAEGQKFIKRNRPPRVQIQYQNPYDAEKLVELPFVMGVMADLSGNAPAVEKPLVNDRKYTDVDMDNFDKYMNSVQPGVTFRVKNKLGGTEHSDSKLGVTLNFRKMDDFSPAGVARQVPPLAKLLEARQRLYNLQRYMDGKVAAEEQLRVLLKDPELMRLIDERRGAESPADPEQKSGSTDSQT